MSRNNSCSILLFRIQLFVVLVTINSCSVPVEENSKRPNIILIMGDDIGYSDLGCYGSEIKTPNLDALANNGIRFQTFYNAAKCNPTRSSLLTGLYKGDSRAINMGSLLKKGGYKTIYSGKEHFDNWVPEHCYAKNSFEKSFYYSTGNQFFVPPSGTFKNSFYIGKKKLSLEEIKVQKKPFYKTDVVTDYALKFLKETKKESEKAPFFLYLPYHVAHYPLQARPEDIVKYRGKYLVGWDSIRIRRFEKLKKLGLFKKDDQMPGASANINQFRGHPGGDNTIRSKIPLYRPWNELTALEKDKLDLEMAVFAAMIDRMDQSIGRIVNWLEETGVYENTIIMYLSDNGSCPYDSNADFSKDPGPADSWRTLGAGWATTSNTPFKYFKQFGHEGGCNTHFIMHWPAKIKKASIYEKPGHITDVFPTILDLAQVEYPENVNGKNTIPLHGKSLYPIIEGNDRETPEYFISGYSERFRMYREGNWKIVKANNKKWELYDMSVDRTEINNLSKEYPEKLLKMKRNYKKSKEKLDRLE